MGEQYTTTAQKQNADLLPSGSCLHTPARAEKIKTFSNKMPIKQVPEQTSGLTYLFFGEPSPPRAPFRIYSSPTAQTIGAKLPLKNIFEPIAEEGRKLNNMDNARLGFGLLLGAYSGASSAKNNKGKDPIPLTPEMLHLLDRL